jgi:hypothetical protein
VFSVPLARPAWPGGVCVRVTDVIAGMASEIRPVNASPPTIVATSPRTAPVTTTRAPMTAATKPMTIGRRGPNRATANPLNVAPQLTTAASGVAASPASRTPSPYEPCRTSSTQSSSP